MKKNKRTKLAGYTLVELMIVLVIVGLLMAVGVPSFRSTTANSLADSLHKQLLGDIRFSRHAARDLSKTVQLLPRNNSWQNGWVVTIVGGEPLRVRGAIDEQVFLTSPSFNAATPIEFSNVGRATNLGEITVNTTGCTGNRIRTITLNVMGQTQTTENPCP